MKADLCVKVNLTETDKFKATINIFKEILEDKNISEEIRNKYKQRLFKIFDASKKEEIVVKEEKQGIRDKIVKSFLSKSYL